MKNYRAKPFPQFLATQVERSRRYAFHLAGQNNHGLSENRGKGLCLEKKIPHIVYEIF